MRERSEMLNASLDQCSQLIANLSSAIVKEGKVPEEWSNSYIVSLLVHWKGSALDRGNHRSLKRTDQVLKVVESLIEKITRKCMDIDDMQFGFLPGRGTTDAIFIVRQLQEKFLDKDKNLHFALFILKRVSIEYHVNHYGGLCML